MYALWDKDELIFIGRAGGRGATIQSMLMHYSWEPSRDPAAREVDKAA